MNVDIKTMRIIALTILCLNYCNSAAQLNTSDFSIIIKVGPNSNSHSNNIVSFPIGYTDAAITPLLQEANIGYDISVSGRKQFSELFNIGITSYLSKFGFNESGNELSFWSNQIYDYNTPRNFNILGLGLESGINVILSKSSKLTFQLGLSYEAIISKSGVHFSKEHGNNKFSFNYSIDYGYNISDRTTLLLGITARKGLKNYYKSIDYKPTRLGITIGAEYSLNC